jgi:hypothetical protein
MNSSDFPPLESLDTTADSSANVDSTIYMHKRSGGGVGINCGYLSRACTHLFVVVTRKET